MITLSSSMNTDQFGYFLAYLRAQIFSTPYDFKVSQNDKCMEIEGNLSSYVFKNALTVCRTHQLDILANLPDVKLYFYNIVYKQHYARKC